ncbi:MAG: Hsp20/alpha crystallin family protein [Nitrospinota bacterium]|nr:MAG: Hsp20/alpha crystallin family protein [Nitrospinota bacterium]
MQWDPLRQMEELRREIDRAFEEFGMRTQPFSPLAFLPGRAARRYPLINLYEDRDAVYVEALAPGVDPASFDLSVVRNVLTIAGEKRGVPEEVKPEAFHRNERAAGKFVRHVQLPVEVDEGQVKADYKNGMLIVTLPKAERAKPKQITVHVD